MISRVPTAFATLLCLLVAAMGCGPGSGAGDQESAIIDPPTECSTGRPDCSISQDFPEASDLTEENSSGIRFSTESEGLVIDRVSNLPDADGDGVPDDADDCPGTPDWISCDGDPTNDGIYATVFYDPDGHDESGRIRLATAVADIPRIDVYFLVDATPTMGEELADLQAEISSIIDNVQALYEDARFGVGLYRAYPLPDYAAPYSQAPYHHVVDLSDDEALVATAVGSLNTVANDQEPTAATQALFSVASGQGLGDMVPNRATCPSPDDAGLGYPCFRSDALRVVINITDSPVYNGPDPLGPVYADPPFGVGVGDGVTNLPPVQMFPALFDADDSATALDLGDLSSRSLTLMGMSTLLTNRVNTAMAAGCATPPPVSPDDPPGDDMDDKDVVLALRFDAPVLGASAFANNTHWPGANVALFEDALLDPAAAVACDGGAMGVGTWGSIAWAPTVSQPYYLVADGIVPAMDPGLMPPEGAFSISIVHDGDPPNPSWLTADAPVAWPDVENALLASGIRVASVVTLRDAMTMPSVGESDARLIAAATDALTASGDPWVTPVGASDGTGFNAAILYTIALPKTDSVYDIRTIGVDAESSAIDERDFLRRIEAGDCANDSPLSCSTRSADRCVDCEVGAVADFEIELGNDFVVPTSESQVFDFELLVKADDDVEVQRIPVRVMVPDAPAHDFGIPPESAFYRNAYDSTSRCFTPPERPKWGDLVWEGSTPEGSTIEFQIRTAATEEELAIAAPALIEIPTDTESRTLNVRNELIADGFPSGLPYIQITAVLTPATSPPATPTLAGWTFEFVCEAAE